MSAFCNTNNNDYASTVAHQCAYCHMYCHTMDDCAMVTGDYIDNNNDDNNNKVSAEKMTQGLIQGVAKPYAYWNAASIYKTKTAEVQITDVVEWIYPDEEYDEDDYDEDHSPNADVRWAKQSSMAAFDHFQRTGAKLNNRDFVGKKAGAYLKSDVCDDYDN